MLNNEQVNELIELLADQVVFPLYDEYRQDDGTLLYGFMNGYDYHLYVRQGEFQMVKYIDQGVLLSLVELGSEDAREFIREGYVVGELSDYDYVKDVIERGIPIRLIEYGHVEADRVLEDLKFWDVYAGVYRGHVY